MAPETDTVTRPGPNQKITDEQFVAVLKSGTRPVWTASNLADHFDITRQTAYERLEELEESIKDIVSIKVGNSTAYYIPGVSSGRPVPVDDLAEQHKQSLIQEFTDKFVGLPTAPWTAVHPNDGPAEAGDKVQLRVEGVPGRWGHSMTHTWENRREELIYEETAEDETQALVSGELYAKPTVPIEHENYPDDYDLELNIGAEYKEVDDRQILIAAGVKNYLIKPCDDAVFLKNVSVDWMSPKGHGQEIETVEITTEMLEDVEAWREEHIDEVDPADRLGGDDENEQ